MQQGEESAFSSPPARVDPPTHDLQAPAAVTPRSSPAPTPADLAAAVERHGKIVSAMRFAQSTGEPYTPEQRRELARSRASLDALRPYGHRDLEQARAADPQLIHETARGRTQAALRALQLEAEMRGNSTLRADVFVQRWQTLDRQRRLLLRDHETNQSDRVADRMVGMAESLHRDPQLESLMRKTTARL